MLAKVVNDDAGILDERGALRFFASKPAPTEKQICFRSGHRKNGYVLNPDRPHQSPSQPKQLDATQTCF
ncbi:hypothetical protein C1X90_04515 [Pseudomonas sp. GP01-A9]|nr:hypothetical protein C0058_16010 [Pseudomonas sp. NC02]PMU27229.1 hypothetical protein C1X90_04515 [Pseudomonas sp. GP01-A9]